MGRVRAALHHPLRLDFNVADLLACKSRYPSCVPGIHGRVNAVKSAFHLLPWSCDRRPAPEGRDAIAMQTRSKRQLVISSRRPTSSTLLGVRHACRLTLLLLRHRALSRASRFFFYLRPSLTE